jgi:hypothetical protein
VGDDDLLARRNGGNSNSKKVSQIKKLKDLSAQTAK